MSYFGGDGSGELSQVEVDTDLFIEGSDEYTFCTLDGGNTSNGDLGEQKKICSNKNSTGIFREVKWNGRDEPYSEI
ncbi:hypothetical protein V6N13_147684 [Hibiscus sabdariffa]|uniref:Uncharacterized protein n=1 Tax=Hibiscus sabdariffa TaxID=183260 RepID=A0ABR2TWK1_9ROSI